MRAAIDGRINLNGATIEGVLLFDDDDELRADLDGVEAPLVLQMGATDGAG